MRMVLTKEEEHLLHVLKEFHRGRENAVTAKELRYQGWGSREFRKMIRELRVQGYPICSGQTGYYYAKDSTELYGTVKYLSSYIKKLTEVEVSLDMTYRKMKQQEIDQDREE